MGFDDTISAGIQKDAHSVGRSDSLRTAIKKMTDAKVSGLIVKSGHDVVGIITVRDVLNSVAQNNDLDITKVSSFMTSCELISDKSVKTPCVQLDEGQSVKDALAIMNEAGVSNLMVTGDNDKAIGIISALTLLEMAIS